MYQFALSTLDTFQTSIMVVVKVGFEKDELI